MSKSLEHRTQWEGWGSVVVLALAKSTFWETHGHVCTCLNLSDKAKQRFRDQPEPDIKWPACSERKVNSQRKWRIRMKKQKLRGLKSINRAEVTGCVITKLPSMNGSHWQDPRLGFLHPIPTVNPTSKPEFGWNLPHSINTFLKRKLRLSGRTTVSRSGTRK